MRPGPDRGSRYLPPRPRSAERRGRPRSSGSAPPPRQWWVEGAARNEAVRWVRQRRGRRDHRAKCNDSERVNLRPSRIVIQMTRIPCGRPRYREPALARVARRTTPARTPQHDAEKVSVGRQAEAHRIRGGQHLLSVARFGEEAIDQPAGAIPCCISAGHPTIGEPRPFLRRTGVSCESESGVTPNPPTASG